MKTMNKWVCVTAIGILLTVEAATAEDKWAAQDTQPSKKIVYKTVGDVSLQLDIFVPSKKDTSNESAIVFFFGGGWTGGTTRQFYEQCKYFASRGMIAISAEYRIKSKHGTSAVECVKDGKSAIRWVRAHAVELGIDPEKIVAGGGSAGGHVAACTGIIKGFEDENDDDANVRSRPNAMVLFNPALDIPEDSRFADRFQGREKELSPVAHVEKGLPPTIIFHGTADTTVPFESVERFRDKMIEAGNTCELMPFEGEKHGFFNFSRNKEEFEQTMAAADRFLVTQGFLKPIPANARNATPAGKRLPRVLIIGDSISIGYTKPVQALLEGKAEVERIPANGAYTGVGLEKLDEWLGDEKWDLIHFNWGLHDLCYRSVDSNGRSVKDKEHGKRATTLEQYEENLKMLVKRLRATEAKLIWASTTPVPDGEPGRFKGDEIEYNAVAAKVMKRKRIPINDLYACIQPHLKEFQKPGGNVHFTDEGSEFLAKQVASSILTELKKREPCHCSD